MEYENRSQQIPPNNRVVNTHYIRGMDNPLIDMLNLKHSIDWPSKKIIGTGTFTARAYVVHRAVVKDDAEVIDYMMGNAFNPLRTVVFSSQSNGPETALEELLRLPRTCWARSCASVEITVDAELNGPGFPIMSEINYPGWRFFVDSRGQAFVTQNYLFRVLPQETGRHHVRFVFNPLSFEIGGIISLASLLAVTTSLLLLAADVNRKGDFSGCIH